MSNIDLTPDHRALASHALESGDENLVADAYKSLTRHYGMSVYHSHYGTHQVPPRLALVAWLAPLREYPRPHGLTDDDGNLIMRQEPDCPEFDAWTNAIDLTGQGDE